MRNDFQKIPAAAMTWLRRSAPGRLRDLTVFLEGPSSRWSDGRLCCIGPGVCISQIPTPSPLSTSQRKMPCKSVLPTAFEMERPQSSLDGMKLPSMRAHDWSQPYSLQTRRSSITSSPQAYSLFPGPAAPSPKAPLSCSECRRKHVACDRGIRPCRNCQMSGALCVSLQSRVAFPSSISDLLPLAR
jgi:hypothetical protein